MAADKNARRGIGEEALYDKGKNCAPQRAGAKSRSQGLTEQEKAEQAALRREYIDAMKRSLKAQLDSTVLVEPDGTRRPLKK